MDEGTKEVQDGREVWDEVLGWKVQVRSFLGATRYRMRITCDGTAGVGRHPARAGADWRTAQVCMYVSNSAFCIRPYRGLRGIPRYGPRIIAFITSNRPVGALVWTANPCRILARRRSRAQSQRPPICMGHVMCRYKGHVTPAITCHRPSVESGHNIVSGDSNRRPRRPQSNASLLDTSPASPALTCRLTVNHHLSSYSILDLLKQTHPVHPCSSVGCRCCLPSAYNGCAIHPAAHRGSPGSLL